MTQITTADGQEYNVVPDYTGDKITQIEVRTGADTSTRVQEVDYTYFDSQPLGGLWARTTTWCR